MNPLNKVRENIELFMTKGLRLSYECSGGVLITQESAQGREGLSDKIALFTFLTEQGLRVVNLGEIDRIGGPRYVLWDVELPDGRYLMSIKWVKTCNKDLMIEKGGGNNISKVDNLSRRLKMHIPEDREEMNRLAELIEDENPKIAFLAQYIRKIIWAADREEEYKSERRE